MTTLTDPYYTRLLDGNYYHPCHLAGWVKTYLLDRKILLSDRQVNVAEFPNLATVEAQLVKDFGPPIIYNAAGNDGDLHFIERGTGRESWS
jgi:hypothetical protein